MFEAWIKQDLEGIARVGMLPAWHAQRRPDRIALHSRQGDTTFSELDQRANRLASALAQAGLQEGDGVALIAPNIPLFVEVYLASLRTGLRLTPISPRLGPADMAYIVSNCDAQAVIVDAESASELSAESLAEHRLRLAANGDVLTFRSYEDALAAASPKPPANPRHGSTMIYTSGTTGRPKGVYRPRGLVVREQGAGTVANYREGDVNLLCGPAYHGASLYYDVILPLASGVPMVLLERFEPEAVLQLIERHRVTHTHMAPTMFRRLLNLPEEVRRRYDLSSLRRVAHGGAPTPVDVKRAMIDWLGPILFEYYASTEGVGGIRITSAEWLRKPGSVGRIPKEGGARVLDETGRECAPGETGQVFFRRAEGDRRPAYYRDPSETSRVFGEAFFTVGDLGHVDEDGYLFLSGRACDRIISGGVNISPQEIDDVLLTHPNVAAACCVGAPSEEWGEEVKAVIVLKAGVSPSEDLSGELHRYVRERLSAYKSPKSFEFAVELPFTETGKVRRADVRARYWAGLGRSI